MADDRPLRRGDVVAHDPPPGALRYPSGRLLTDDAKAPIVEVLAFPPDGRIWSAPRREVRLRRF